MRICGVKQDIIKTIGIEDLEDMESVEKHVKSKTNLYGNIGKQIPLSSVIEYSKEMDELFEKAKKVQSQNHSISKVHGVQHVQNVLLLSNYLGLLKGVSSKDLELIQEAAIYHDICHEKPAEPAHAKKGADWYLENVDSALNKEEVSFLIESHELNGKAQFGALATRIFSNIDEKRKLELIRCAEILQDADRLDILRYDIEKPEYQRFKPEKLNNRESAELISAVIELNTRQAISKGYLHIKDNAVTIKKEAEVDLEDLKKIIENGRKQENVGGTDVKGCQNEIELNVNKDVRITGVDLDENGNK